MVSMRTEVYSAVVRTKLLTEVETEMIATKENYNNLLKAILV